MKLIGLILFFIIYAINFIISEWICRIDLIYNFMLDQYSTNIKRAEYSDIYWAIRLSVISVLIIILIRILKMRSIERLKKYEEFVLYITIGWISAEVVDRIRGIVEFNIKDDTFIVIITLIIAYRKYLCRQITIKP